MAALLSELRHNPLLWLLVFVPVVFVAQSLEPEAHTLLFVLSVLAIVPLATLLSHATESVAAKTGDTVGGLLNATLGNLTELVIALAALRAGQYMLVKASIAGAIVTNTLFMLGASFLLGGLKYHVQEFNRISARLQASLLFLATIALLIPSAVRLADAGPSAAFTQQLSLGLSGLLILAYGLGMVFSLRTHRELFAAAEHGSDEEAPWPIGVALATLAGVTVLVALVSEVFVESVQQAAVGLRDDSRVRRFHRGRAGRRCGGDGVGVFRRAQEPARSERGHCLGERLADRVVRGPGARAAQLCDRPHADGSAIVARRCGDDAHRDAHRLARDQQRTIGVVRRRARLDGLPDLRDDAVPLTTRRAMTSSVGLSLLRELAPQVLGAVIRRYGDFSAAEEAVQEALLAAAMQWPHEGVPDNPRGWLIHVAARRIVIESPERQVVDGPEPDAVSRAGWDSTGGADHAALYSVLKRVSDNQMVALNHAIAAAMVHGPAAAEPRAFQRGTT